MHSPHQHPFVSWLLLLTVLVFSAQAEAQKKSKKKTTPPPAPVTELGRLRDEYVKATKEYKSQLQKLIPIYEGELSRAEEKLKQSRKLLEEGLIARVQLEESERGVAAAQTKLAETRRQMSTADDQIAGVLVEADADAQFTKDLRLAKQRLVRTSSLIRFTGGPGWNLSEAWKVQRFFSDTFNKQLPVAVFGQGAIHDRWRLDHRNSMDVSLHPDSAEGQALLSFLERSGIPYLAFRSAIPGTATGPHIHIGRPSHRY